MGRLAVTSFRRKHLRNLTAFLARSLWVKLVITPVSGRFQIRMKACLEIESEVNEAII
jgi:hypothetical protein